MAAPRFGMSDLISMPDYKSPKLSADQMRRRIQRLKRCMEKIELTDGADIDQTKLLEVEIDQALSGAFGSESAAYRRFIISKNLISDMVDINHIQKRKDMSIKLLEIATRTLEEEIDDIEAENKSIHIDSFSNKIFIVHGRDDGAKNEVALFLRAIGLEPIILHLRPNGGRHLLTKFGEESEGAGFAIVLMTPDDEGCLSGGNDRKPRARQNVVFELGFFIGKLGPANVAVLVKGEVERPSDFDGIAYISFNASNHWKTEVARELHHAKIIFDAAKMLTS